MSSSPEQVPEQELDRFASRSEDVVFLAVKDARAPHGTDRIPGTFIASGPYSPGRNLCPHCGAGKMVDGKCDTCGYVSVDAV